MSAPTAFDGGAVDHQLAWRVPAQARQAEVLRDRRAISRVGRSDRRRPDALRTLARAHDDLCTQAVDASEIAAGLESSGIGDRKARLAYGEASVFDLAEQLYAAVPRRPADAEVLPTDPWRQPWWTHAVRGLVYAIPGALYVLALQLLAEAAEAAILITATVLACGVGQGVSLLGHVLLGRADSAAAGQLMRWSLVAGGGAVGLSSLGAALLPDVSVGTGVLAGAQVLYLVAATILILLRAERLLLAVLLPGVLASVATLTGAVQMGTPAQLGVLVLSLLAALVAAAACIPRSRVRAPRPLRRALGRADLLRCSAHAGYGLVNAGLVSFAVLDVLLHTGSADAGYVAVVMAPLILSLGVADYLVHRLRSRGAAAMARTASLEAFARLARAGLARTVTGYAAVLLALTLLVQAALMLAGSDLDTIRIVDSYAYAMLGVALFLDTVLLSLGRHGIALVCSTTALVLDLGLRWAPLTQGDPMHLAVAHLVVFTGLVAVLLPVADAQYRTLVRHR